MSGEGHRAVPGSSSTVHRWGLRVLTVTVVVALLAGLGVGVTLSAPSFARAVGLPVGLLGGAAADPPDPATPRLRLAAVGADAPAPTEAGLATALDARVAALGDVTGAVVDPATGATLWSRRPAEPQVPASVTKLLTGAAALLRLDPTMRWTTTVVAGPTPDSVVLVGGGDPTLSSLPAGRQTVYPDAARLDDLVTAVRAARAGQPAVERVYVDVSRYENGGGNGVAPGWDPTDVASGFVAPIVPVMLDGGRSDPTVLDVPRTATPASDAARELGARLAGGGAAPTVAVGPAPPGAPVLGQVVSPPTTELVRTALQNSDNVLAEALGREVARAVGEPTTFDGAARAVTRVLDEAGIDTTGVTLADTSGLSVNDRVPATALSGVLAPAAAPAGPDPRTAALRPLLDGLPVAGGGGTLADRYAPGTPSADGRGWVRAKTGTLTAANALAGVVDTADGRVLVFSFMSNGVDPGTARPRLDALAAALHECGCR
ncbi:D-alanyl-D-alanine carboxypeptidase/D-alanyl-D-alanine endopeptidase [Actinomycetospora lemnae]|uniref:D-alanyl-D-alanine carboxypeptidase/D-alanyl-D-alanine-endopeptidase n=1 Tax=Actinomycetospora lemnae TaxID=3019891 RepID=A0ABT5T0D3_9PSEU|nr:D-alanyl-D-alanine carboxypeptidase/D-alanyl-D-alanine-endopeptidase [Actinomycetospora sp. DW7H6]MDD7967413.1 D-alanyl-D-alanine carboxypeptidase/D-alanyl-D-alanine-endopeptidase [Actinomycetospora sp. DW7H6]